ncbi:MAG: hypothetical protein ACQCN6_12775 [Candidatus Bathyarchaeia archaeon]
MTYDEGLRSYKAIAFIESLTSICYCKLGATPQQNVSAKQIKIRPFSKCLGENLWIK